MAKVHPEVAAIREPLQSLTVNHYLDGGSLAITIVDADGRRLQAALPIGESTEKPYPRLFLGTNYVKQVTASGQSEAAENVPGVLEVESPHDTMLRLQELLDNYEGGDQIMIRFALAQWRGDVRDRTLFWGDVSYRLATEIVGRFGSNGKP